MVLLNDLVQVLGTPHSDSAPSRVLASQEAQRPVAWYMAIECDLARSSIRMRGERLAKERLRSGNAPIRSQHEVYAAPLLVHGSVQIVPFALDRDVSLINAPGATDRAGKSIPPLLKFRNIPNHPAHDRRVRNVHATLGHHRNEISVAQAISDVPAHAQNNDLGVELALHIDRVTILAFGHRASPSATQSIRRPLLHRNRRKSCQRKFLMPARLSDSSKLSCLPALANT